MDRYGDMKKNGSGYYDETPYKAMTGMHKPGEIWVRNTDQREVLVLKDHNGFCTVLQLSDNPGNGDKIQVISTHVRYTHPGKLMYMYNDLFGKYISKIPHKDFVGVQEAVSKALALPFAKQESGDGR